MKRLMLCRGIETTALKGEVILNLLHFSPRRVYWRGACHIATTCVADFSRF